MRRCQAGTNAGAQARCARSAGSEAGRGAQTGEQMADFGEPALSSTLLLPDEAEPSGRGGRSRRGLYPVVDAVIDSGECGVTPTTVVDRSQGEPEALRRGTGDPSLFSRRPADPAPSRHRREPVAPI